ncbi:unnamed protein product [Meloidogyne enterolobii]|uniref:Uncharacterized protein n=1 Tax=Meloidogyne enterolobii TaxID=390850 RepID=A0ACB1B2X1_MELEN
MVIYVITKALLLGWHQSYTHKSDIYSLGISMWEMAFHLMCTLVIPM